MRSDGTGAGGGTLAGRTQGGTTAGAMIGDATTRVTTDAMTTAATTGDMITIMPIGGTTMVTMIGGRMAATTIGGTNGASTTGTTAGGMSLATTPSGANTRAGDGMAGGKVTHRVAEVLYFQISGSGYGTRSLVPACPPACALWLLVWYCTLSAFVWACSPPHVTHLCPLTHCIVVDVRFPARCFSGGSGLGCPTTGTAHGP